MNIEVRYTEARIGDSLPYSVSVTGEVNAKQLPRNHPDWVNWGIDILESEGKVLPFIPKDIEPELTEDELIYRRREDAKVTRDLAIESPIKVFGVSYQVHVTRDEPRINRAIDTAIEAGYPEDYAIDWILTDNTTRPTTASDLRKVLVAKALREEHIFVQYKAWLADGMKDDFLPTQKEDYLDVLS